RRRRIAGMANAAPISSRITTTTRTTIMVVVMAPVSFLAVSASRRQQPVEEGAVALQCLAEFLGVGIAAALPLRFQPLLVLAEPLGQRLHQLGHQSVRGAHGLLRIVDEASLGVPPPLTEPALVGRCEQRHVAAGAVAGG